MDGKEKVEDEGSGKEKVEVDKNGKEKKSEDEGSGMDKPEGYGEGDEMDEEAGSGQQATKEGTNYGFRSIIVKPTTIKRRKKCTGGKCEITECKDNNDCKTIAKCNE